MRVLIDSNVLLRVYKPDDRDHVVALESLARLRERGDEPVLVPQVLYEFYVVATRPLEQNGLSQLPVVVVQVLDELQSKFAILRDRPQLLTAWMDLLAQHKVRGKPAHDARLVAAVQTTEVQQLLTFNVGDFSRYAAEIQVAAPPDMVSESS